MQRSVKMYEIQNVQVLNFAQKRSKSIKMYIIT